MSEAITNNLDLWTSALRTKSTVGRGSNGKQEAYGIKKLRELILELAVRGKLVSQDPNDEPASQLLKRVAMDKAQLVEKGMVKKNKEFPAIAEDEIPFNLPMGWEWARINDVGHDWGQKIPDSEFTYIDVSAIDNSLGVISTPSVLVASDAPSRARKIVKRGTVIYSTVRPNLKNICVIEENYLPKPIASTAFAVLHPFQGMPGNFFALYFRSPEFVKYVESVQAGIAYPAINDKQFYGGFVPVPPLAEQHRIVAKVNELMALCDKLEKQQTDSVEAHQTLVEVLLSTLTRVASQQDLTEAWTRIANNFDALFTTEHSIDQLRQTILQLAVMGKLVPQDPSDEPANVLLKKIEKEKKQLAIAKKIKVEKPWPMVKIEETPFQLPQGWQWVRLGTLLKKITDGTHHSPPNTEIGEFLYITAKNIKEEGILLSNATYVSKEIHEAIYSRCDPELGDVLYIKDGATTGLTIINNLDKPFSMLSSVALLKVPQGLLNKYLLLSLRSPYFYSEMRAGMAGVAITRVTLKKLNEAFISLPPCNEQHRIVAKVDKLMALCDALKARLADAQTTQIHLADAIVEQAVA